VTASGTKARKGTIAADTRKFPFGTIMYIEGYGYGRVEDRGGAIKGNHIDLYFRTHQQALEWGKQTKRVKVWLPK
jgi:3D (Asp-Asp-Asp) domain-containing protein